MTDAINGVLSTANKIASDFLANSSDVVTINGGAVSASSLIAAAGTLASYFATFEADLKAKAYLPATEITIEEGVTIASKIGVGAPFTGIAALVLPFVFQSINTIAAEPLVALDGGLRGWVTVDWSKDPREQLNADGTFKIESIIP